MKSVFDDNFDKPKRTRAYSSRTNRISAKTKKKLQREQQGGSTSAKLVAELEKRIFKPVKCSGKNWFSYEKGVWTAVERNKESFKPKALDVQEVANTNVTTASRILEHFEYKH